MKQQTAFFKMLIKNIDNYEDVQLISLYLNELHNKEEYEKEGVYTASKRHDEIVNVITDEINRRGLMDDVHKIQNKDRSYTKEHDYIKRLKHEIEYQESTDTPDKEMIHDCKYKLLSLAIHNELPQHMLDEIDDVLKLTETIFNSSDNVQIDRDDFLWGLV